MGGSLMPGNPMTVRHVEHDLRMLTGRTYQIDWSKLSEPELREVQRMIHELDDERRAAQRHAMRWGIYPLGR